MFDFSPEVIASIVGIFANIGLVGAMIYSVRRNTRDVNKQIMLNSKMNAVNDLRGLTANAMYNFNEFDACLNKIIYNENFFSEREGYQVANDIDNKSKTLRHDLTLIKIFLETSNVNYKIPDDVVSLVNYIQNQLKEFEIKGSIIPMEIENIQHKQSELQNNFLKAYGYLKEIMKREQQHINNPENNNLDNLL